LHLQFGNAVFENARAFHACRQPVERVLHLDACGCQFAQAVNGNGDAVGEDLQGVGLGAEFVDGGFGGLVNLPEALFVFARGFERGGGFGFLFFHQHDQSADGDADARDGEADGIERAEHADNVADGVRRRGGRADHARDIRAKQIGGLRGRRETDAGIASRRVNLFGGLAETRARRVDALGRAGDVGAETLDALVGAFERGIELRLAFRDQLDSGPFDCHLCASFFACLARLLARNNAVHLHLHPIRRNHAVLPFHRQGLAERIGRISRPHRRQNPFQRLVIARPAARQFVLKNITPPKLGLETIWLRPQFLLRSVWTVIGWR